MADEVVVGLVLRRLRGDSISQLVRDTGIHRNTIKKWCNGENRSRCYFEAQRQMGFSRCYQRKLEEGV